MFESIALSIKFAHLSRSCRVKYSRGTAMLEIASLDRYFMAYRWENKHSLYGYPADEFREFRWIASLEARFGWLKLNHAIQMTSSVHLIREMIQWGGSQNGVLQKFEDGLGELNLFQSLSAVISQLGDAEQALEAALQIPGMGLTYASKLLRFLDPERFGALDSRLRGALEKETVLGLRLRRINDGDVRSVLRGYAEFLGLIEVLKQELERQAVARPECSLCQASNSATWRAADIEMALFSWAAGHGAK